jgi:hypothetical protein
MIADWNRKLAKGDSLRPIAPENIEYVEACLEFIEANAVPIVPQPEPLKAPKVPCGSCPYRRDVPSGIWHRSEYDKLPKYDGETWEQSPALFMCHQRDGRLCGGWLACHGPGELLALRIPKNVDPAVYDFKTDVPVFASGAEARAHGLREVHNPGPKAGKMIEGLLRKRDEADNA